MPRTSPERPAFLGTWWEKVLALVVLVAAGLLALHWWDGRQSGGPARPGMAPATVLHQGTVKDGETDLTVRYSVDGKSHETTDPVNAKAFRSQGGVAWVCYAPSDPTDASIRLPEDPLCGQN